MSKLLNTPSENYVSSLTYGVDFTTPVKLTQEEVDALKITIHGFEFISFPTAIVCPKCGKQASILNDRQPDDTFDFYIRFGCNCNTPAIEDEPVKVQIVPPLEGTVVDEESTPTE